MNSDPRTGLGLVGALVVCCAGPIVLSLVGSGVVLSALSGVWADVRPLLTGVGALLVIIGVPVLALSNRARAPHRVHPDTSTVRE